MDTIGLEVGKNVFRIAHVTKKGASFSIDSLQEGPNVKLLDLELLKKRIVTGLGHSALLLKQTTIKLNKLRDLKKTLPFQMQTLTSLPFEEALFSPHILKQDAEGFHLLYFITTKQHVKDHLEKLSKFSLDPDLVSAEPMALANAARFFFPDIGNLFMLHFERDRLLCLFIENHFPLKVVAIDLEETLFREKKVRGKKEEGVRQLEMNGAIRQKIEHAFAAFTNNQPGKLPLLVTGEAELFSAEEGVWVDTFPTYVTRHLSAPEKEGRFACVIGLAIDSFNSSAISFCQNELTCAKHLALLGKKAFLSLLGLFLLFASLAVGAEFFFKKRKAFFEKKIEELSTAEYAEIKTLDSLEKSLKKEMKECPYYLQDPQPSSVLLWLKTHPVFGKKEKEKPLFELIDFHYELSPMSEEAQKPVAHVEIEFVTEQLSLARAFHESLLEETPWVEKKDFEWEPLSENRYRVAFYFKTVYKKIFL
jgi:hypothetical protein